MGLKAAKAPDGWLAGIQDQARRLLAPAVQYAGSRPNLGERLEASTPIPISRLSTADVGEAGLGKHCEVAGWRSLVFSVDRPEEGPIAAVRFEAREGGFKVTGVQTGEALKPLLQALEGATTHAQASATEYALRLLEVPGLLFGAVLLESQTPDAEDLVFPLLRKEDQAPRKAATLAQANASLQPAVASFVLRQAESEQA